MRRVGSHTPRKYGSIEAAQQQLIHDTGGLEAAANACSRTKSTLQRYTDDRLPKTSMPVHIVAALQAASGTNPVTEHLAALANLLVIALPPTGASREWLEHISKVTSEFADVLRRSSEFLADDGDIDSIEARELLKEIDDTLKVLGDMRIAVEARATGKDRSAA